MRAPLANSTLRVLQMNYILVLLIILILRHYWAASLKTSAIPHIATDVSARLSVCMHVCLYVCLSHWRTLLKLPGTLVWSQVTCVRQGPRTSHGKPQEQNIWGSEPTVRSDATYQQITLTLVIFVDVYLFSTCKCFYC